MLLAASHQATCISDGQRSDGDHQGRLIPVGRALATATQPHLPRQRRRRTVRPSTRRARRLNSVASPPTVRRTYPTWRAYAAGPFSGEGFRSHQSQIVCTRYPTAKVLPLASSADVPAAGHRARAQRNWMHGDAARGCLHPPCSWRECPLEGVARCGVTDRRVAPR
jgi:hypothetical protein